MELIRLRTQDLAWHEVDGAIICLDIAASRYLSINPAGAALWPLLLEGAALPALTEQLVSTFGIGETQAATDVEAFLGGLRERKLLDS